MNPQAVWDGLSDVERTSLQVAFLRWYGCKHFRWLSDPHEGQPLYTDPYGEVWVKNCIPPDQQQLILQHSTQVHLQDLVAIRTAELDELIAAALQLDAAFSSSSSSSTSMHENAAHRDCHHLPVQQMVILGAGTDTRAWRLQWPGEFIIFEVDSQAVLNFKRKIMEAARQAAGQQQQQQEGQDLGPAINSSSSRTSLLPDLQCTNRVEVVADASQAEGLWSRLLTSGFDAAKPTLYLMEGFIGYLTVEASNALLHHLHSHSVPGSRVIITAPPSPEERARSAAAAAVVEKEEPLRPAHSDDCHAAAAAAAAAGGGGGGVADSSPFMKLYHSTFEEPTDTLARLSAAGWSCCELSTSQHLMKKYQRAHAQPILLGMKE